MVVHLMRAFAAGLLCISRDDVAAIQRCPDEDVRRYLQSLSAEHQRKCSAGGSARASH